eukprot:COSAG05_NODE_13932_length_413_cov_1.302548_2_plen_39_part_01
MAVDCLDARVHPDALLDNAPAEIGGAVDRQGRPSQFGGY